MSGMTRDNPLPAPGVEHWRIVGADRWSVKPVLLQRGEWRWGNCPRTGRAALLFRVAYESEHDTVTEATAVCERMVAKNSATETFATRASGV